MESTPDAVSAAGGDEQVQPLRDEDATMTADPEQDPAQAEWERTQAIDEGSDVDATIATGRDPDEIPDPEDEIPFEDLHTAETQPETQDDAPVTAELGEDGQGDLSPEDL